MRTALAPAPGNSRTRPSVLPEIWSGLPPSWPVLYVSPIFISSRLPVQWCAAWGLSSRAGSDSEGSILRLIGTLLYGLLYDDEYNENIFRSEDCGKICSKSSSDGKMPKSSSWGLMVWTSNLTEVFSRSEGSEIHHRDAVSRSAEMIYFLTFKWLVLQKECWRKGSWTLSSWLCESVLHVRGWPLFPADFAQIGTRSTWSHRFYRGVQNDSCSGFGFSGKNFGLFGMDCTPERVTEGELPVSCWDYWQTSPLKGDYWKTRMTFWSQGLSELDNCSENGPIWWNFRPELQEFFHRYEFIFGGPVDDK